MKAKSCLYFRFSTYTVCENICNAFALRKRAKKRKQNAFNNGKVKVTNILLFLVICLNEILFTGCTVFLRLNYTTIVQLLYHLNNIKCVGLQPYLTRLTGLPVDEIIQLFGWMVAINPLGQAGSSLQPIRIILKFCSPNQNQS